MHIAMCRKFGVLGVATLLGGPLAAQYSYVPSPPPCPAPAPTQPTPVRRPGAMPTVGVLALHLQRTTPEQRYLADAFPDAVASRLATVDRIWLFSPHAVRRIPPTSVANAVRVARELGTRYLVTGILTTNRGVQTLSVVLYDTAATEPIWQQEFRDDAASLLGAAPTAAVQVATRLLPALTDTERASLIRLGTTNPAAFEQMLRGDDAARERGTGFSSRAVGFFQAAIAADPKYADAHAALALALVTTIEDGAREAMVAPEPTVQEAIRHAEQATTLEPTSAHAWSARAVALSYDRARSRDARAAIARAITLESGDPEITWRAARVYLRLGMRREGENALRATLQLSPSYAPALGDLGDLALAERQTELACGWLNAAIVADPYRPLPYVLRALARRGEQDVRLAWSDAEIAVRLGSRAHGEAATALVDIRGGDSTHARATALKLFREFDRRPRLGLTDARLSALALTAVGERVRAISLLERVFPRDDLLGAVLDDPALASIRTDPRIAVIRSEITNGPPPATRAERSGRP